MYEKVAMANARTMELRGFSEKKMTEIILTTLGLLFDTHHPDINHKSEIDRILCDKEKNSAKVFVSVASLTIASKRINVCWLHAGVYDQFLCQFFRGVLYYALAFVKQYTKKQKYFVSKNFKLRTYKTKSGNHAVQEGFVGRFRHR